MEYRGYTFVRYPHLHARIPSKNINNATLQAVAETAPVARASNLHANLFWGEDLETFPCYICGPCTKPFVFIDWCVQRHSLRSRLNVTNQQQQLRLSTHCFADEGSELQDLAALFCYINIQPIVRILNRNFYDLFHVQIERHRVLCFETAEPVK